MKIKIIIAILFIFFSSCKTLKNNEQSSKGIVTKTIKVVDEEYNPIKVIFAIAVLAKYDETHCCKYVSDIDFDD